MVDVAVRAPEDDPIWRLLARYLANLGQIVAALDTLETAMARVGVDVGRIGSSAGLVVERLLVGGSSCRHLRQVCARKDQKVELLWE